MAAIVTTMTPDGKPISVDESKCTAVVTVNKSILREIANYCERNNINEPFVEQLKSIL